MAFKGNSVFANGSSPEDDEINHCSDCSDFCDKDDLQEHYDKDNNLFHLCKSCLLNRHEDIDEQERELDNNDNNEY